MTKLIEIKCDCKDYLDVNKFTSLQNNLKDKTEDQLNKLKNMIVKYGFSFPLFVWLSKDNTNYIMDGHGRDYICSQLVKEGYLFKHKDGSESTLLPIVYVDAKSKREAKEKLLALNSSYGKITHEGLYEYVNEPGAEIDFGLIKDDLELHDIDTEKFDVFYGDKNIEIDTDSFSGKMTLKIELSESDYHEAIKLLQNINSDLGVALMEILNDKRT